MSKQYAFRSGGVATPVWLRKRVYSVPGQLCCGCAVGIAPEACPGHSFKMTRRFLSGRGAGRRGAEGRGSAGRRAGSCAVPMAPTSQGREHSDALAAKSLILSLTLLTHFLPLRRDDVPAPTRSSRLCVC